MTPLQLDSATVIGDPSDGPSMSEPPRSLQSLAQAVVETSKAEYLKILGTRLELDLRLDEALHRVGPDRIGAGCDHIVEAFRREVEEKRTRLAQLIKRQRLGLDTFNIALFGRTGAGKSSLTTALTRGDGTSISQGESDWTTEVAARSWERAGAQKLA
ncbi:hypothetical protein [Roseateles sp.]|uniref:hypothetical protein n=1 Tax=Roseateles sp. TaxID=1971397 RepID=UPI00326458A2